MGTLLIYILVLSVFIGCSQEGGAIRRSDGEGAEGRQVFYKTTMESFGDEGRVWKLYTDNLQRVSGESDARLSPVKVELFDTLGAITAEVISDSGSVSPALDHLFLWGSVYIVTEDSKEVRSNSLGWNRADREFFSDDFVEIRVPGGERMRGRGFRASENFSWWQFTHNVSGDFPGFGSLIGEKKHD